MKRILLIVASLSILISCGYRVSAQDKAPDKTKLAGNYLSKGSTNLIWGGSLMFVVAPVVAISPALFVKEDASLKSKQDAWTAAACISGAIFIGGVVEFIIGADQIGKAGNILSWSDERHKYSIVPSNSGVGLALKF